MSNQPLPVSTSRDEMRHISGSSEPDVIIGSDKDRNRVQKEGQRSHGIPVRAVWRGRYFVQELTSEANSRMQCVAKILAMLGTKTTVADLCMFGLAACDEGGPGFVNASVRTSADARQNEMRMRRKCTGTHRHAHVDADNTSEKVEQTGTWVRKVARAMEEYLRGNQQELKTREQKKESKGCKEDTRDSSRKWQNQRNKSLARRNGEAHASR